MVLRPRDVPCWMIGLVGAMLGAIGTGAAMILTGHYH